jgi:hypothetical protein
MSQRDSKHASLPAIVYVEFLWDAVGRVKNPQHPSEDIDLTFFAEPEKQALIEKILKDANKLQIVRTDVRFMFFRANCAEQLDDFFAACWSDTVRPSACRQVRTPRTRRR